MSVQTTSPVVVGLDGTDQGIHAVQYAVAEARRLGCGVRLVHVLPDLADAGPIVPVGGFELFGEMAGRIMQQAEQAARAAGGADLRIEKVVRTGMRVHVLVETSEDAALVVLGHRDRPLLGRVFTASTSTGVATRAHCPVVCIPSVWSSATLHGQVVVGVEDFDHAHELLVRAFASAARRRVRLRVIHTWKLQRPYDDVVVEGPEAERWTGILTERLAHALADLKSGFPEVDVDLDVRHQDPGAALLGATEGADLLLLGRRGHGAPLGFSLGSITRALIRESRCPVEVVPLSSEGLDLTTPDLALEESELSPQT